MNVGELIKELQTLHPETEVILQRDPEGNGYSPLAGAEIGYAADDGEGGRIVLNPEWTADEAGMETNEWEFVKKGPCCVVIFPLY